MSVVTNIILNTCLYFDDEKLEIEKEINSFFDGDTKGFVNVDDEKLPSGWYGGTKMLEAELWIGAFNHIDLEGLIEHLRNIKWDYPEEIQLMVKKQEDEVFRIINVFETK